MLNLILAAIPALGSVLTQGKTKELLEVGTKVAKEIFGTTDQNEIEAKMASDPALAAQFQAKLEAETAALQEDTKRFQLQIEDTANARASNQALVQSESAIAWSGPVIDTVVVFGFFGTLFMLLARPVQLSPEMLTLLTTMVGFLGNNFAQIVNYHRGSSAGSAIKDRMLQAINVDNSNVAARVVEAAKAIRK